MKAQWNTGRQYDEHGQRMVAVVDEANNQLLFHDLSRGLLGAVPLGDYICADDLSAYDIEQLVMVNYDFHNYSGSFELLEWED